MATFRVSKLDSNASNADGLLFCFNLEGPQCTTLDELCYGGVW